MSEILLKELLQLQGAYVSAIDISDIFNKSSKSSKEAANMAEKVQSYLVNDKSIEAIMNVAQGLSPGSNERTHLISGAYGTGKSHLGLVLANYFSLPSDHTNLQPVLTQIQQDSSDKAAEFSSLRASPRRFLVVLLTGDEADTLNQALLQGLRSALIREKLSHLVPRTGFQLAVERIKRWEQAWKEGRKDNYEGFQRAIKPKNVEGMIVDLNNYDEEAYKVFNEAHRKACEASFEAYREDIEAKRFYADLSEMLAKETDNFQGIVVIWDEYHNYVKRIAQGQADRGQTQSFAQFCNNRSTYQCHFIVIAHLTLRDYFENPLEYAEYVKQSGRFKESTLTTSNPEELISRALSKLFVENPNGWKALRKNGNWEEISRVVAELDLYPMDSPEEVKRTREKVLEGCFPLHPLTLYCLPKLSEEVAQRTRSTFNFLSEEISQFLEEKAFLNHGQLNLYTVDRLLDYFGKDIADHKVHRRIARAMSAAEQKATTELQSRILKVIAIFDILKDKKLVPTAGVLFSALYLPTEERDRFNKELSALEPAGALRKTAFTEEYRLRGGEEYDYAEDFKQEKIETLRRLINPFQTLNQEWQPPDIKAGVSPEQYNLKFSMNRALRSQFIGSDALASIDELQLTREIDGFPYLDGMCLYVVATNEDEITKVRIAAEKIKHTQVAIAIPNGPSTILDALIDGRTAKALRGQETYTKPGTDAFEEAREHEKRYDEEFQNSRQKLISSEDHTWYVSGKVEAVAGQFGANDLASRMMFKVFPDTPKIDSYRVAHKGEPKRKGIKDALEKLMDLDHAITLKTKPGGEEDTALKTALRDTGILRFRQQGTLYEEWEVEPPLAGERAHKAWACIDSTIKSATEIPSQKLAKAVTSLMKRPFGMSDNAIVLFLAAYFRYAWKNLIVLRSGVAVSALDSADLYQMVGNPSTYTIIYRKLESREVEYLKVICKVCTEPGQVHAQPSILEAARCLRGWYNRLPDVAKVGQDQSKAARALVAVLEDSTTEEQDLLFAKLPRALEASEQEVKEWESSELSSFEQILVQAATELQGYAGRIAEKVFAELRNIFSATGSTEPDLANAVKDWFNGLLEETRQFPHMGDAAALKQVAQSEDPLRERFLNQLPQRFGIGSYLDWSDSDKALVTYIDKVLAAKTFLDNFRVKEPVEPQPPPDWKGMVADKTKGLWLEFSSRLSLSEFIDVVTRCLQELKNDRGGKGSS